MSYERNSTSNAYNVSYIQSCLLTR